MFRRSRPMGLTSEWVMAPGGELEANPTTPPGEGWNLVATGQTLNL